MVVRPSSVMEFLLGANVELIGSAVVVAVELVGDPETMVVTRTESPQPMPGTLHHPVEDAR